MLESSPSGLPDSILKEVFLDLFSHEKCLTFVAVLVPRFYSFNIFFLTIHLCWVFRCPSNLHLNFPSLSDPADSHHHQCFYPVSNLNLKISCLSSRLSLSSFDLLVRVLSANHHNKTNNNKHRSYSVSTLSKHFGYFIVFASHQR